LKGAASRRRTLLDQQQGASPDETTGGIAAKRTGQSQNILTIVRSQRPGLPFLVHQDSLGSYGLHGYGLGYGRAVPEHGGRSLSSINGNLVNVPPADQTGFAEAREVGGHHLIGNEGRAKAAIISDEAIGFGIGVDIAGFINHLVDSNALGSGRQA
jgi:hypothetical protein